MFATALMAAALSIAPAQATSTPQAPARPAEKATAPASPTPKLPVSLPRIRRQLARETKQTERFENFRLISSLHVYGQGPQFEVFSAEDRYGNIGPNRYGAVAARYGSPTHAEFLSQVTPDNFEAPVMNLSGGLFSLSNWIAEKKREAQRRKETEERQKR
jgi:hypothetical protein